MHDHPVHAEPISHLPEAGGKERLLHRHQYLTAVAQGGENEWLQSQHLVATQLSWTHGAPPAAEFACTAKTRYRQADQPCRVWISEKGCKVEFDTPQRAVTPGQSIVFYRDEECLGGGIIDATDAPFGGLAA